MAKLTQIFLELSNYKVKDKTCKSINFKRKINQSNTSVMINNDIFSPTYTTKVLFSLSNASFLSFP